MIEPKQIAELDQALRLAADSMPPLWRRLYHNCVSEGFTEDQAMQLVKTFIISQGIGDKKP